MHPQGDRDGLRKPDRHQDQQHYQDEATHLYPPLHTFPQGIGNSPPSQRRAVRRRLDPNRQHVQDSRSTPFPPAPRASVAPDSP